jgi:hypothetical protein
VTLENRHIAPLPPQLALDLVLTVSNAQSDRVIAQCRQPADLGLMVGDHRVVRLPVDDCSVILQEPGTHLVRAELLEAGAEALDGEYSLITGDLDAANNGAFTTLVPVLNEGEDSLPTELTRIIAGLAIFFAVMALVAAGAEVAIDSLKVAVGLKRKVTSMEALERMEKYLPGQLGALSVSAATQEEFRRMIREMRSALGQTLKGVESFVALREQIAGSEFGASFRKADELGSSNHTLSSRDLYNYKKYLQAYITTVLNTLENRLHLSTQGIKSLRDQLAQEISLFDGSGSESFLENLMDDLQDPHFWSTQLVDGWLNDRQEAFYVQSSSAVIEEFDREVGPLLVGVGFTSDSIESLRLELVSRLGTVEAGMTQSADTFLHSVRNVLDAVELRRYDTQSPSRKAWRKLRGWRGGTFPPLRLRSTIMPAFYMALFFLYLAFLKGATETGILGISAGLLGEYPWLSWLILFFLLSMALVLTLYFARQSFSGSEKLWFIGLYGATALAFLIGLVFTLLLWVLQPLSANRVSGLLQFFDWLQPWWSWLIIFSLIVLVLLLVTSLIAKAVYDRLMRSAVRDGKVSTGQDLLEGATVIHRVETLWNLIRQGFDVSLVDPAKFDKAATVTDYETGNVDSDNQAFVFSPETTAQFIMARSDQQRDEETSRLRILRVLSIVVGLIIAYALQIDVLNLLGEAFPDVLDQLNWTIVSGETLHAWRNWLPVNKSITVGIVLTAFAASAGSAFWHDRLDQLQASKKGAQAAAQLLSQASQVADSTKREG